MKKIICLLLFGIITLCACDNDENNPATTIPEENNNGDTEYLCTFLGDVYLASQADVDAFVSLHPCSLAGHLYIGERNNIPSDITNLDGMESLTKVYGGITITKNPLLTNIEGLKNITYQDTQDANQFI